MPPILGLTRRRREGQLTDGPSAETKEVILGFHLLECADIEEAVELAAQHPMARFGRLELRALWRPEPDAEDRDPDDAAAAGIGPEV
jgi:hypothetical protein